MAQRNIKQTNTLLFIFLVIQLAVVAYVFRPTPQNTQSSGPLLQNFQDEKITAIAITDNENQSITLNKSQNNWEINRQEQGYPPLPADNDKVQTLLEKVAALSRSRVVTRTPASHNRLKVGSVFNRKIEFKAGEDKQSVLFLGSSPNYKSLHVRLDGEDEVYLDKDLSIWEAPTAKESWWRTQYIGIDPEILTGLELTNGSGPIKLRKNDEGLWHLAGKTTKEKLDQVKVDALINDLAHLTIQKYLPADYKAPAEEPIATAILTTATRTVELTIALQEEQGDYLAKSSSLPYYAKTSHQAVKDILAINVKELTQSDPKNSGTSHNTPD